MAEQQPTMSSTLLLDCSKKLQPNGSIDGEEVMTIVRRSCGSFASSLCDGPSQLQSSALENANGQGLTHGELRQFILGLGTSLHQFGIARGDRVAILLPNGPVLAVALVSLMQWTTCIPLNSNGTANELAEDLRNVRATAVLGLATFQQLADDIGVSFAEIQPIDGKVGLFQVHGESMGGSSPEQETPNNLDDNVLLLFTSGTTGNKRIVPYKLESIITGGALIATSWKLSASDVCLNMMPLYHVGGILRQIVAPLLSGGCTICAECFDPFLFWELLSEDRFSWYYAAPTMHHVILQSKPAAEPPAAQRLRFLANAAGGLSPSLASQLAETFSRANLLPSYGSTECMPITSPPSAYRLEKPGTSGVPVGPRIKIVDTDNNGVELPFGAQGRICIKGSPCFQGYLNHDNSSAFLADGFFDTGDLGHLDEDGYLFISGRSKEVINRGGEIICPAEVEEVVSHHESISTCMAFSANHDVLQEVVGIAVVLADDGSLSLTELHSFLRSKLSQSKWPQCLVVMDDLPKSHTNKILRVGFGSRLGLPTFTDTMPSHKRCFHALCPDPGTPLDFTIDSGLQDADVDEESWDGLEGSFCYDNKLVAKEYTGPSTALNGVRFVAGFFVVFGHIGTYPSAAMLKLQAYSLAMQIFFFLASFQMSCKVKNEVLSTWSLFVGSKIGSLHALFAVTQLIAMVPYLLFQCGTNGFEETFENITCNADHGLAMPLSLWALNTATGLVGSVTFDQVNSTNWFMGVLYTYIVIFPWLHSRLQRFLTSPDGMFVSFLVAAVLAIAVPGLIFLFFGYFELNYTIVTWIPSLLAASIAGTFFSYLQDDEAASKPAKFTIARKLVEWARNPRNWAIATDAMSVAMIILVVAVALSPRCLYVDEETLEEMRPGSDLPTDVILSFDQTPMYWVCNVSYDEWHDHVRETCGSGGRWITQVSKFFRFGRFGSPFVWLWLFGMSFGQGYTATLMKNEVLQRLSPLAYPLYLLHLPVAQLYWLATRGREPQEWWDCPGNVAVPVNWYELLGIVLMCLCFGHLLDRFLLPHLIPKSIQLGLVVCRAVSRLLWWRGNTSKSSTATVQSSFVQVSNMIRAGSGLEVSPKTLLADTGLDSLGLTALLGNLRASVPSAKSKLTLQRLAQFETVGELSCFLDGTEDDSGESDDGLKTHTSESNSS